MAITLNTCQIKAVDAFVKFLMNDKQSELVISGYAGTGKTTLVKHLLDNLDNYIKSAKALGKKMTEFNEVVITATTHKAARVISDSMNTESTTIHSYLNLLLKNDYKTGGTYLVKSPNADVKQNVLLFVDEASFLDDSLLSWIRQLTYKCKIVYMGDPCQLITVNAKKSPVFDGLIPTVKLTTVMRNDGAIERLSAQYRETVLTRSFAPAVIDADKVQHVDGQTFKAMIEAEYLSPNFIPDVSVKILAWTNDRVHEYNEHVSTIRGATCEYSAGDTLIANRPLIGVDGKIILGTDQRTKVTKVVPAVKEDLDGTYLHLMGQLSYLLLPTKSKRKPYLSYMPKIIIGQKSSILKTDGQTYGLPSPLQYISHKALRIILPLLI